MEEAVEGTRSACDQIAETYAAVNSGDMPEVLLRLAHKLIQHMEQGARIIGVGYGSGPHLGN